ncbi:MAG: prolyl oligopeptidase family serine peptidase [Lysobacter sp.]
MSALLKMLALFGLLTLSCGVPAYAADDAAALHAAVAAERTRAPAPRFERSDFLVDPVIMAARLSPDGLHVAYLRAQGRTHGVWLLPTAGAEPRQLLPHSDAQQLYWSRDSRWLLLESADALFALAVDGQAGSGIVSTLGGRLRRELLGVDPVQPTAVLVLEQTRATVRTPTRWRLLRVDTRGKRTLLHEDTHQISDFAFDSQGRLAFLQRVEGDDLVIHRVDRQGRLHEFTRCVHLHRCSFLPVTNADGELMLAGNLDGNLSGLLRLDAKGLPHTLHVDPRCEADLDALVLDPLSGQPLIASYRSTVVANHGLADGAKRHVVAIEQRFPRRNIDIQIGRGGNAQWLIRERASNLQGERWHLYDPRTGRFRSILAAKPVQERSGKPVPWIPESALARKIPFAYDASDGMRLHGFLSLPPGVDPTQLPLIANVHGGPFNHARPVYGDSTQLLVNRGYAVFEPNFRGSTGHGRDYMLAAQGDFGNGRVQRDIVEGVRYLLAQGIGDADRVGIIGYSFGGYSTLLGVTFAPELFKVGVAGAAPPDFAWDLIWVARSSEALNLSERIGFKAWLRMLSLDVDDPAAMVPLHAQSPLANADQLQRPLLMFASGKDGRVPIRGVLGYTAKLNLLGKDVSLLVDPDAGHSIDDPLTDEAYLYLLEYMLHRHLGGAAPTKPDKQLGAYLERNMRLRGQSLRNAPQPL